MVSLLAKQILRDRRAVHPGHGLAASETAPMIRKPSTGEPYAGKPPVRFGGRGGQKPSLPLSRFRCRPPAWSRLVRSRHGSSKRLLHDRFWELVRGKPAFSYPRKRVSSGTRRGDARLAPGGVASSRNSVVVSWMPAFADRVRGHDTRETPHPGSGCLVQGDRPQAGNELAMTGSAYGSGNVRSTSTSSTRVIDYWASPN